MSIEHDLPISVYTMLVLVSPLQRFPYYININTRSVYISILLTCLFQEEKILRILRTLKLFKSISLSALVESEQRAAAHGAVWTIDHSRAIAQVTY